jgi:hypothetical protein
MKFIATAFVFLGLAVSSYAAPEAGPGASNCLKFARSYNRNPALEEHYFIWAQGYMSSVVMMAPGGIDDNLNLSPASYPKEGQMAWSRSVCAQDPFRSYGHAVRVLYRHLGGKALD